MRKYKRTELEFLKESEGLTSEGLTDEVVAKFKDDKENVPVVLGGIGQTFPSSKYYISRKRSPTFTLEYVVKGKGYVIENNIERTVGPDDVFLLHYGATQNYYPDKNDPFHKIWVNFNSDIFASAIKVMNLENEVVYHAPECKDDFLYLLKLSDLTTSNSAISYEVSNVIFKILTTLAQKINERDMLDDLPTIIRNELNKSIYKHTTVEEIADKMMISRQHLNRVFKNAYNISPYQYLRKEKIKVAEKMLLYSKASIESISDTLGFVSPEHFYNTFKQKNGMSPIEYRKAGHIKSKTEPLHTD